LSLFRCEKEIADFKIPCNILYIKTKISYIENKNNRELGVGYLFIKYHCCFYYLSLARERERW
jgi:hypothetical protein